MSIYISVLFTKVSIVMLLYIKYISDEIVILLHGLCRNYFNRYLGLLLLPDSTQTVWWYMYLLVINNVCHASHKAPFSIGKWYLILWLSVRITMQLLVMPHFTILKWENYGIEVPEPDDHHQNISECFLPKAQSTSKTLMIMYPLTFSAILKRQTNQHKSIISTADHTLKIW